MFMSGEETRGGSTPTWYVYYYHYLIARAKQTNTFSCATMGDVTSLNTQKAKVVVGGGEADLQCQRNIRFIQKTITYYPHLPPQRLLRPTPAKSPWN